MTYSKQPICDCTETVSAELTALFAEMDDRSNEYIDAFRHDHLDRKFLTKMLTVYALQWKLHPEMEFPLCLAIIVKIAVEKVLCAPNWRNYTPDWKEDMRFHGFEHNLKYVHNFNLLQNIENMVGTAVCDASNKFVTAIEKSEHSGKIALEYPRIEHNKRQVKIDVTTYSLNEIMEQLDYLNKRFDEDPDGPRETALPYTKFIQDCVDKYVDAYVVNPEETEFNINLKKLTKDQKEALVETIPTFLIKALRKFDAFSYIYTIISRACMQVWGVKKKEHRPEVPMQEGVDYKQLEQRVDFDSNLM
jgi:phenylpyruvate tautomerase PptA (4-oxalocrotonate tautomerase family)